MKKLTQGATRLLVLALGLGLVSTGWAGLPTITVSGNDVTISTDSGSHGNIGTNNGGYDTLTIPAATDLASGTVLRIKSISLGARTSGTAAPASVVLAGVSSAAAAVTTSGYTDRDKYTYVFATPCLMKVGTGSTISFRNSAGEQANVGLAASLTGSTDQDDYLFTTLRATSGNNKWSVLTEIVAEKVTGYINETKDGFNTTVTAEKVYVSGVTGYLNTVDAFGFGNVDELVVVDGEYTYGYKVVNGNSPQNNNTKCNRAVAFKKLSGTGTITNGDHGNGPTPVMGVCDSSEFAGSINIGSATTRLSVLFCTEAEISAGIETSLEANLYSLFTSETGRSRIYVSPGRTTANNAVVTVPAGKTWTAVNGITNNGELVVDGTVSCKIVNAGKLTVNGTVTGSIANSGSGTVTVNAGATLASFGSVRDFTGFSVNSSVPVKITMSAEEYGKGSLSISGASGISSITVLAPDGTTVVTTLTPEAGAATYSGSVIVSGKACWCDYEFNGDKSNSGVDTTGLSPDTVPEGTPEFVNNQMLYTYTHPYRGITYPNSWTAVVRCTVPELENAVVVMFGTYGAGAIGLIAGPNPEEQMLLVSTPGSTATTSEAKHFTTLATMNVRDATTAQHVYVFTKNGTTVNVYCDGDNVLSNYELSSAALGGGLQIGSLHGGVTYNNVDTGLVRFGAGETQISSLTIEQQQNARIDCMRMYDYIVSPEQIAALTVEFPSVKLYRATVVANATTDWGSLTWSPSWDGGNSSSKIILTVEGDASLTLPDSITANEFVMNVPAANVLTLSKASGGTTLAVTEPIEVSGGTIYFNPGMNQSIGLGNLNFGGTGTVRLGNGTLVDNNISGAAKVEIQSGSTVIVSTGSIANPITGSGGLAYATLPSSALSFSSWTGTVQLPAIASGGIIFNNYGTTGSTVYLTSMSSGAWINPDYTTINPKLYIGEGGMTLSAMSTRTYTFAEIDGPGNLSFATTGGQPTAINITKVAEGYTGTISNTTGRDVTITTLDRAAETPVTAGSKVLSTSSGVQASALTLAGVATGIIPVFDTDGLYVKAASVTKNDATVNYDTVSAALTAAGNDAATIKLLMPTDSAIALAAGQTLVNGNLTSGGVTGPNGYEVVNNNGTYTLVDNTASTWAPGEESDNSWNTGANWSTGYKPTQYTSVTFPASVDGWTVGIPGNAGNEKCASMTLNGDVTFQRGGSNWAKLCVYGAISGNGTLTLNQTCIENDSGSVIEIPGPVTIVGSNDSAFLGANGWTIAGNLSVGGYFKTQTPITVTGNAVFAASGAMVETQSAITITGTTTLNGDFSRDTTYGDAQLTFGDVTVAASTAITGAKPTTFSGTVTLDSDATLTVPTATTTVSGATFATSVADSYVKATEDGSTTIYSVAAKRTVTVSTDAHSSVTGVTNGQKFVPGDVLTITASADTYYTPTLTVNSVAQTSPYELTTTDADVTVAVTATLDTYTITIPPVANTTVSVSYTSGGEAQVATAAGAITVDAGTSLTATWTAASGYKITAGASQTINQVTSAQTLTSPTVEAKGATVSGVTFNYGDDFATATVTATVSGDATGYTLTVGGKNYNGVVNGSKVTFSEVATGHSSAYDNVSYTITASDGGAAVPVTGGSGSAVVADMRAWIHERATSSTGESGSAADSGGSWTTEVTYNDNVAAVENNTFTAYNCSTGDCVTATVNDLVYTSLSDTSDMSVIANDSQGAVALGETNVNEVTTMCFMILAKEDGDFVWKPATWGGNTPQLDTPYDIAVTFDYAAKKYSVCIDGTNLTVNGTNTFNLCAEKSELKSITFNGEGTLRSIEGIESTGYMVKAANGTYYATFAAAIAAYNADSTIGELYVLHDGTVPVGWMIIEVGGVKYLRKAPKGSLFIAF